MLKEIQHGIIILKHPKGSKLTPGRTCADIMAYGGQSQNYWIDPNGGFPKDAIEVKCLYDRPKKLVKNCLQLHYNETNGVLIESELETQFKRLQITASSASQTFSIQCRNLKIDLKKGQENLNFVEFKKSKILAVSNASNHCQEKSNVSLIHESLQREFFILYPLHFQNIIDQDFYLSKYIKLNNVV